MRRPPIRHRTATGERFIPGFNIRDYRIVGELRSEDTGMVYEAEHLVLPRRAAIKVMHPSQAWLKSLAVQMLREAAILEALSHPGIPRIYECGVLVDKRPWVAVELIEGTTLADLMTEGPLGITDLVSFLSGVANVLEHAHARGVVHHRLGEGVIVRTPHRTSQVCVRGWGDVCTHDSTLAADPSSDVHALGALAFRALTGLPLTPEASTQRQCPSAPPELTSLIDQMLAADPAWRPGAGEVRERVMWLAKTLELVPSNNPRWTPVSGVATEGVAVPREPSRDFVIRIK